MHKLKIPQLFTLSPNNTEKAKARMFSIVYGECPHLFATEPYSPTKQLKVASLMRAAGGRAMLRLTCKSWGAMQKV